jgi:hypothetical protein
LNRRAGWLRVAFACVVLACVAGCGASLVYPRLDTLVGFYIKGLVSLDENQSAQLADMLEENLQWHRRAELGRYEASLRRLAAQVQSGLTAAELHAAAQQAEAYWRNIFEQAAPGYTTLAATLTDDQVRELLASLHEADEKTWRDYSKRTTASRAARREKSMRRNVERMTGRLQAQQVALIHDYAVNARPFMSEWRENRRIWRDELAATLGLRRIDDAGYRTRMQVLIARPDELWTPQYRQALDTSRSAFIELLVRLDATLTPQQRALAHRRLLEWASEVRGLSASPARRGEGRDAIPLLPAA